MPRIPGPVGASFVILASVGVEASCSNSPAIPSLLPAPQAIVDTPIVDTTTTTLSGIVYGPARQPLPGAGIYYLVRSTSPTDRGYDGSQTVDRNGRYVIQNVHDGERVTITAFSGPGGGNLVQQCAASKIVNGETALDIELVPPGSAGPSHTSPTLSGVVTEKTTGGLRPVPAGTWVGYTGTAGRGMQDAYTRTDAAGRYSLCALRPGGGELLAGDCNEMWMLRSPVHITGDTALDIDLTAAAQQCPGFHF